MALSMFISHLLIIFFVDFVSCVLHCQYFSLWVYFIFSTLQWVSYICVVSNFPLISVYFDMNCFKVIYFSYLTFSCVYIFSSFFVSFSIWIMNYSKLFAIYQFIDYNIINHLFNVSQLLYLQK